LDGEQENSIGNLVLQLIFQGWVLDRKLVAFLNIDQKSTPLFSDKLNTKTLKLFSS
jgi:hypothetical protein